LLIHWILVGICLGIGLMLSPLVLNLAVHVLGWLRDTVPYVVRWITVIVILVGVIGGAAFVTVAVFFGPLAVTILAGGYRKLSQLWRHEERPSDEPTKRIDRPKAG